MKRKVYRVKLPYLPHIDKVRMVSYLDKQPYFFAEDVAKAFKLTSEQAMKLAMPHVGKIYDKKTKIPLVSLYGYWKVVLLGRTPDNRCFQQSFLKTGLNSLYKNYVLRYLKIVQGDNKHEKQK